MEARVLTLLLTLATARASVITYYTTASGHADTRDLTASEGGQDGGEYGGIEGGTPNPLIDGPAYTPFVIFGVAPADPATLGDRLATLVDQGGTVIEVPFTLSGGVALGGRWASSAYGALQVTGGVAGGEQALASALPGDTIFSGVSDLTNGPAGWIGTGVTVAPGATVLATWADGSPAAAIRDVGPGRVITLNLWPGSERVDGSWLSTSGDAPDLLANLTWFLDGGSPPAIDADQVGLAGGPVTLTVRGGTPGGRWAMITAPDAGGDVIPGGACAGVQTGLDRPRVLRSGSFDGAGDAEMSGSPSVNRRFQRWAFVDVSACVVTEVHWLR